MIGYSKKCLLNDNPDYICSICKEVFRLPVQTSCGHRFCKYCVNKLIEDSDKEVHCEQCKFENNETLSILKKEEIHDDKAFNRELSKCKVKCFLNGCIWKGLYIDLEKHLLDCEFATENCLLCGKEYLRTEAHECEINKKCFLACSYNHENTDIKRLSKSICRHSLYLKNQIDNLFDIPVESKNEHDKSTIFKELIRQYFTSDSNINKTKDNIVNDIESRHSNIDEEALLKIIEKLFNQEDFKIFFLSIMKPQIVLETSNFVNEKATEMSFMTVLLEGLKANMIECEKKLQVNEAIISSLQRKLIVSEATIKDLEIRLNFAEQTSFDGTLIWQITDFARKRDDALSGKNTSIFSKPFYSSLYGYKMAVRIYLNGDGMGKGTHVSLFFVIMKGNYDVLLSWPFKHSVTMSFLDQINKNHIVDAFKPDPTSSSFRQPTTEMNIASGCPLFLPLNKLNESTQTYVKNDTAYIKIVVDLNEGN